MKVEFKELAKTTRLRIPPQLLEWIDAQITKK